MYSVWYVLSHCLQLNFTVQNYAMPDYLQKLCSMIFELSTKYQRNCEHESTFENYAAGGNEHLPKSVFLENKVKVHFFNSGTLKF